MKVDLGAHYASANNLENLLRRSWLRAPNLRLEVASFCAEFGAALVARAANLNPASKQWC
jgi:hypothetical protein